jgi:hypothetical protein
VALGSAALSAVGGARAEQGTPVIWYRSSEGCPDGAAFIARLHGRAAGARLAEVNDRIDFVVTLGKNGEKSSGRLERQTAGSTVAIREIETDRCEDVADVLALTLTLALNPTSEAPNGALPASAAAAEPAIPPASPVPSLSRSEAVDAPRATENAKSVHDSDAHWLVGGRAGAVTGPTGALGPALGLFVEHQPGIRGLPGASGRLAVSYARTEDDIAFTTVAGGLEGCPIAVGGSTLELRPCLGVDLGAVTAEGLSSGGRSDTGTWLALEGLARMSWLVSSSFVLELEGGASLPLIQYSLASDAGVELHHADPIGFFGMLGGAARLP